MGRLEPLRARNLVRIRSDTQVAHSTHRSRRSRGFPRSGRAYARGRSCVVKLNTQRGSASRWRIFGRLGRGSPKGRSIDVIPGCGSGKSRTLSDSSDHRIDSTGSPIDSTGSRIGSTRHLTDSTRRGFGSTGSPIDSIDCLFDLTWQRFNSIGRLFDSIDRRLDSTRRRTGSTRFGVASNDCTVVSSEVDGLSRQCLAGSTRRRSP
jgi:hypothetical protein